MLTRDHAQSAVAPPIEDDRARPAVFAAIVDSAMDAVVALDTEQRIVLFNPAAEAMLGCPAAEAIGQPLDRFLPARFRGVHRRHVAAFGATGDTARAMGHLRALAALRADGTEFPIEATISRIAIDGQPYYAAIVRDISAREAAEAALRRQANLLDLAYDAIFTWDWDGPITSWNQGAERLYGISRREAVGRVSHDLLRTRHPVGVSGVLAAIQRDGVWEGELVHTRRDGTEVIVESRQVLVRKEDDQAYVLEANRDITARKRAEAERAAMVAQEAAARAEGAAVSAQRDQLRVILGGLPSGVEILAGPDGRVEFANPAMVELIFGDGAPPGVLPAYGRDFRFLRADGTPLPADERPGLRALRGERVRNQQLVLERGNDLLPVSTHAAPLAEEPGAPARAIVVVQDVTQLREAEQLKDDFLALISHEFRTPLTAIHGGAHLLATQGDALDAESRSEVLHDVVAESARLDRMLANILSLADVMAGRLRTMTEPVLIAPLARRVANEVARRASQHTFVVVAIDVPPVEADPNLLEEVLRNLYENAIKYAPDGGEVRTMAEPAGAAVAIHITDQGSGIAPESVGWVFERFRRVGGDPTVRGMGLGLYLSRHLVEAMGGRITVGSPGLGRGTTFTVTLPLAHDWAGDEVGTTAPEQEDSTDR